MNDEKIRISLEDINSACVDAEVKRQEIASRMAAHQSQIESETDNSHRMNPRGIFRRSIVYMAFFGLIASLIGWLAGEIAQYKLNANPLLVFREYYRNYQNIKPYAKEWEFFSDYRTICEKSKEIATQTKNNLYFTRDYWDKTVREKDEIRHKDEVALAIWNSLWYVLIALVISMGVAVAEPVVSKNGRAALINGALGVVLGGVGGFVVSLFVNDIYIFLGGGSGNGVVQQMFARGIGWSILGFFVAIAPGIVMRSWKKFGLGLAGGAIGGLLGGILFDVICKLTGRAVPARCFNILGLGLGAAVATALLENLAKQGWLRVATGVITGKQFILYRNPTIIGSSPKSEIYLFKDPTVAARHAAINGVGGRFLVTALGGATVLLNGSPVKQQQLKNGDQIRIGNTIFLFEARVIKKGNG